MIVIYSSLKRYLPTLNASAKEISEVFTLTGFMLDKLRDIKYLNNDDYLIDLEVRQNRADSLGVIGLARELSSYYNISLNMPGPFNINYSSNQSLGDLPISIKAKDDVKRVKALKLSNINISESPDWLKEYLSFYDIKSINNLVDLTNYVMIETGIPSHAFDLDLVGNENLTWEINNQSRDFTTLSGEVVKLKGGELIISDGNTPLSLSMVGGKNVAINQNTKEIILEMGIYNNGLIRRNSRDLKIITEASTRLEKFLDTQTIDYAFDMLVSLLIQHCNASISSNVFDEYIQKPTNLEILVDLDKLQRIAGIEIKYHESIDYLTRLGFEILDTQLPKVLVKSPTFRTDISLEEDIFEEVIRLKGFNNLDTSKLNVNVVKDITPLHLNIIEKLEDLLVSNGFDEIRSWVLVDEENVKLTSVNNSLDNAAKVTNSINEEVPFLRTALSFNLIKQYDNYVKHNISDINIFEIGKVFGKDLNSSNTDILNKYFEYYSLGILKQSSNINDLKMVLEKLFRSIGLTNVSFTSKNNINEVITLASLNNFYEININDTLVGLIFLVNPKIRKGLVLCELNIDVLSSLILNNSYLKPVVELEKRIIELDTNIVLDSRVDINKYINDVINSKLNDNVFKYSVIDSFPLEDKVKHTVRISYLNLSDSEAKELHSRVFDN